MEARWKNIFKKKTHLDGKDGNTTGTLSQDPITGLQRLESIESVPSRQGSTRQGGCFNSVQVGRREHESFFIISSVLLE